MTETFFGFKNHTKQQMQACVRVRACVCVGGWVCYLGVFRSKLSQMCDLI